MCSKALTAGGGEAARRSVPIITRRQGKGKKKHLPLLPKGEVPESKGKRRYASLRLTNLLRGARQIGQMKSSGMSSARRT